MTANEAVKLKNLSYFSMTSDEAVKRKTNCKKSSFFSILCRLREV